MPFIFLQAALSNWLLGLWFWTEFLWQSPYFKDLELACFKFFFQWSLLSVVTVASPLWCCSFFLYTSCNYKKKKKILQKVWWCKHVFMQMAVFFFIITGIPVLFFGYLSTVTYYFQLKLSLIFVGLLIHQVYWFNKLVKSA